MKKVNICGGVATALQPETPDKKLGMEALRDAYWCEEYSCIVRFRDHDTIEIYSSTSGWLDRAKFIAQFAKQRPPRWLKRSGMFGHISTSPEQYDQGVRFDEIALGALFCRAKETIL